MEFEHWRAPFWWFVAGLFFVYIYFECGEEQPQDAVARSISRDEIPALLALRCFSLSGLRFVTEAQRRWGRDELELTSTTVRAIHRLGWFRRARSLTVSTIDQFSVVHKEDALNDVYMLYSEDTSGRSTPLVSRYPQTLLHNPLARIFLFD